MSEKFIVMIKLSRWRAKIVTSLLPTPALLAQVVILKLSRMKKTVMVVLNSGISDELVTLERFWKIVDAYLTVINKDRICQGP